MDNYHICFTFKMFERQDNDQTIIRRELDEKEYFTRTREKKEKKKKKVET